MSKRKSDALSQSFASENTKKAKSEPGKQAFPDNKPQLLDAFDSSSGDGSDSEDGGVLLEEPAFKINEEYAKRFEHNKKREELQRLEEKYQKDSKPAKGQYGDKYDEDEDSSSDEDEDDEGFLATEDLDAQISATLQAIRSKDPRVYDEKITFYAPIEEGDGQASIAKKEQKPMYLRDYHRENLLQGQTEAKGTEDVPPMTFAQEQEILKSSIVKEMHAAADTENASDDDDSDGGFLIPKSKPTQSQPKVRPSRRSKVEVDVTTADKDPETFLSNFMAARAWVPGEGTRFEPIESDDDDDDDKAEKFEEAYNLRFENPEGSNEVLKSYARDIVAAKTVRREEPKGRKKQRAAEREKKQAEKRQQEEERGRLRSLKIEQMGEKVRKIKKAAGLKGKELKDEDWMKFLDEGWDDDVWESEMSKRFGAEYYAQKEEGSENDSDAAEANGSKRSNKPKKPKWEDDIDIKDLVPEFEESTDNVKFSLSDSDEDPQEDGKESQNPNPSKARKQAKIAARKTARVERSKIEALVDASLPLNAATSSSGSGFRYRETSPTSFGLTPRDILFAPDSALNQFVGLKKMATFRDKEKKTRDRKKLGKKARLREWRRETFGEGMEMGVIEEKPANDGKVSEGGDLVVEGGTKRKKKRSRKAKVPSAL